MAEKPQEVLTDKDKLKALMSRVCELRSKLEELADDCRTLWEEADDEDIGQYADDMRSGMIDASAILEDWENEPED